MAVIQCPSCGNQLEWAQQFAPVAVCGSCQNAIVVDKGAISIAGKMSALADTPGPLYVGASGRCRGRDFTVLGRVRYGYNQGFWDEWSCQMPDGRAFWVGEDEYNFTLSKQTNDVLPASFYESAQPGGKVNIGGQACTVMERGVATCEGGEGQLPFLVLPGEQTPFLDLNAPGRRVITVEFEPDDGDDDHGAQARVFSGVRIDPEEFRLDVPKSEAPSGHPVSHHAPGEVAGARPRISVTGEQVEALNCFCCGGALDMSTAQAGSVRCGYCSTVNDLTRPTAACPSCATRIPLAGGHAVTSYVCPTCHEQVDTSAAEPALLGHRAAHVIGSSIKTPVPLGKTGTLRGERYVVTGHIRFKTEDAWGVYLSDEFMLYSDKVGYEWLGLENGHWSLVKEWHEPVPDMRRVRKAKSTGPEGLPYRYFEGDVETIIYVNGQLPYVAHVGDTIAYDDWISPPKRLTAERTENEAEFFIADYLEPTEVAEAFGLDFLTFPPRVGIAPHQPKGVSPSTRRVGLLAATFALVQILLLGYSMTQGQTVTKGQIQASDYRQEFLTEPFTVSSGGLATVTLTAPLNNSWAALDGAFITNDNAVADFSVAWEHYRGVEGGESWSEGSNSASGLVRLPGPGEYQLLVKGESQSGEAFSYKVEERVVLSRYFVLLALFFAGLAALIFSAHTSIEKARWDDDDDD